MKLQSSKELYEFQNATIRQFRKTVNYIMEQFTVSQSLDKHINNILSNLEQYELVYDTLINVREVCARLIVAEELSTIEKEMKVLNDSFWN